MFEKNVFINCPFDEEYYEILRPILFTIIYLGFNPRIASERSDSGEPRISKICELINKSKFSIHDLSRLKSKRKNEFYRLNMPFELGIEYGCRYFASDHLSNKKCLILEKKDFEFKKALSDLSGVDIKSHGNDPPKAVKAVRDWFVETVGLKRVDGPTKIGINLTNLQTIFIHAGKMKALPMKISI
jgi:predicted nucleotide-binding protein